MWYWILKERFKMIVLQFNYSLPGIYFEPTLFQGHFSLKFLTNTFDQINIHCKCQKQLNFIFMGPLNLCVCCERSNVTMPLFPLQKIWWTCTYSQYLIINAYKYYVIKYCLPYFLLLPSKYVQKIWVLPIQSLVAPEEHRLASVCQMGQMGQGREWG